MGHFKGYLTFYKLDELHIQLNLIEDLWLI